MSTPSTPSADPRATSPGAPCWIDLFTSDAARVSAFYGEVFGWQAGEASPEFGGYFLYTLDGAPVAGAMPKPPDLAQIPDTWGCYFATANAQRGVEAIGRAGGAVQDGPMAIADLGSMVLATDPGEAVFGLWQPDQFAGFGPTGPAAGPGTACYLELHTRAYDACVAFYRDAVGWDTCDRTEIEGMRYTTLGPGSASAGIMDATDFLGDLPAHWAVYFAVADTDDTVERVGRSGGTVLMPPVDTPFGRMAQVTDPGGAMFKLLGATRA